MGILDRFSDIIKANINDLLDKAEDPGKMIDQYMRDLAKNLADVKSETAGVMAEEARAKRLLDENTKEIEKYDDLSRKALETGNEDDARAFIGKKQQLEAKASSLLVTYDTAHENAKKMRQMHDKLVGDLEALNSRREAVKAKVAVAKTQEKVNKVASGAQSAAGAASAFDRMEAKADQMLDRANALTELNEVPVDAVAALEEKYAKAGSTALVDDELAKLKEEMGL